MNLSTFQLTTRPPGFDTTAVLHETIDAVVESEALGYKNVWLAEHHGTPYCLTGTPSILAGALAVKTHTLGIGFAVNIAPLYHPVRLAEDLLYLDHLTKGRIIAGFGAGNGAKEFALLGVDFATKQVRGAEAVELINRLWTEKSVDHRGDFYQVNGATLAIEPYQKPHPPIAVAISNPDAARAIGAAGNGINTIGDDATLKERIDAYAETKPANSRIGVLKNICITGDAVSADRALQAARSFVTMLTGQPAGEIDFFLDLLFIIGTKDEVRTRLQALAALGITEVLCSFRWGDLTDGETRSSMREVAELMPVVA